MSTEIKWTEEYGFGRPLSYVEKGTLHFHKMEMWILTRTLMVTCLKEPTLEQVNEALLCLMKWNPSLRMSIRKKTEEIWEFVEETEAKPKLECLYNEGDWKKVGNKKLHFSLHVFFFTLKR